MTHKYKYLVRWQFNRLAGIYLIIVHNGNTRIMIKVCSKLTIKTLEDIVYVVLVSLLLTVSRFHTVF